MDQFFRKKDDAEINADEDDTPKPTHKDLLEVLRKARKMSLEIDDRFVNNLSSMISMTEHSIVKHQIIGQRQSTLDFFM